MNYFYWIHGLPGAGKTTTGNILHKYMLGKGMNVVILDGDSLRDLFGNYDYTKEGRDYHMKQTLNLVSLLMEQGINIILCNCAMENYYREMCEKCSDNLREIYLDVSIEELIRRDQKQLYSRALRGEIQNVRGINMPYDVPLKPELVIKNDTKLSPEEVTNEIIKYFNI